jgi:hypothetical protein
MQLKVFIDQILKKPDSALTDENLVVFDKLSVAMIKLVYGNSMNQDQLRDLLVFQNLVSFLSKSVDWLGSNKIYNEGTVISILNLLVNSVDTNK